MIKRYFIVVLLLSLLPAGCRHNAVQPLKKIGKRNTIMWVQCITDVFSYTGAERAAIPVWAVFIRTAVSVIRTPAVRWSSRSSMTMPIVFQWVCRGRQRGKQMKLIGKGNSYGHPTLYVKNW